MKQVVPRALLVFVLLFVSTNAFANTITLLYVPINAFLASFVAKDQGYFTKHGLDIDMKIAPAGGSTIASLVADSAQIGTTTPPQLLQADEQGLDIVAIAGGSAFPVAPHTDGLLARTGSGIKTARDLIGKKVGITGFGSTTDIPAKAWVRASGVDEHSVNWVEIQFPQLSDALKSGLVDAEASAPPFMAAAVHAGIGYELLDYDSVIPKGTFSTIYVATRAWVSKNTRDAVNFQLALADAVRFIEDDANLDSVRKVLATYTHLPPQIVASLPRPAGFAAAVSPAGLAYWVDAAKAQGLIDKKPDPKSLIAKP